MLTPLALRSYYVLNQPTAVTPASLDGLNGPQLLVQHEDVNHQRRSAMLVPLSALDQNGVDTNGVTLGYVLKSVDNATIEVAARRMVAKWRLLAGRVEWDPDLASWRIRVPTEGEVSDRIKFTTQKLAVPLDSAITPLEKTSVEVIPRPSIKFFRCSSTPSSLKSFASSNAPIISIHVTELTNCVCVGVSVPHGVFDAFGIGQIIRALDAEMNGKAWAPPALSETNIMQETLKDLLDSPPLYTAEPIALSRVRENHVGINTKNILRFVIGIAYEYLWKQIEVKAVYLGEKVVEDMVRKVKDDVESGSGWVSTGDALLAWFLKVCDMPRSASCETLIKF